MYFVWCEEDNKSFFRYKDEDGNVVTKWEKKGWQLNRFTVNEHRLLWHCVGSNTNRISFGYKVLDDDNDSEPDNSLNEGRRFGLDPEFSQSKGVFFIDQLKGRIHFSSNISGKTITIKYISDSLATDDEMIVHKFAEEAMYKYIAHAILATRSNTPEYIINRFKKERFAEIRKAKLRLSNIKSEELAQVMRGKSKQIKH